MFLTKSSKLFLRVFGIEKKISRLSTCERTKKENR